jgi:cytochrome P450
MTSEPGPKAGAVHEAGDVDLYYDPFDFVIDDNPYPVWRSLREEAPLYYNDRHDFYALSRHADVADGLYNWQTFRSGRGTILEVITNEMEVPSGLVLFEDPPLHDLHRKVMSRVFTPRRMNAIEPMAREFTVAALDPLVGSDSFDFIADLGGWMPMRTIGCLLGIPEQDQSTMRDNTDKMLALKHGGPRKSRKPTGGQFVPPNMEMIADYVDWRAQHPSDDLMTDLLNAQVDEQDGTKRTLSRGEVMTYISTIMGAGSETTTRLIGFVGQLLSDHPDQRRELAADRSLIPLAIEEVLRYEAPSPVQARYVAADTEHYGHTVPEGSVMLLINGSANRDQRRFPDPDRFDIHRRASHLSFGQGLHFCLGAALARMEARVALEEVLHRWPDWEVDYANAVRAHTTSVRGWGKLPVRIDAQGSVR